MKEVAVWETYDKDKRDEPKSSREDIHSKQLVHTFLSVQELHTRAKVKLFKKTFTFWIRPFSFCCLNRVPPLPNMTRHTVYEDAVYVDLFQNLLWLSGRVIIFTKCIKIRAAETKLSDKTETSFYPWKCLHNILQCVNLLQYGRPAESSEGSWKGH